MSAMRNAYDALLVLPDGRGISPGETAEISEEMLAAPGVVVWIDQGKLVDDDDVVQPEEPGEGDDLPSVDDMDEDALTAELEAAGVDIDGRWGRDTLAEKVTELRAS